MIATEPNAILVYHTYCSESAYAQRYPRVAASIIAEFTPEIAPAFAGEARYVFTNISAPSAGRPA